MLFVFMSQPDFACNPHALWRYIEENTEHETGWILKKNERYETLRLRGLRCGLYDTLEGNRLLAEADYVIMNSYTFQEIPKRENQIFVNLWHGSGIKAHDYFDHHMGAGQARKLQRYFDKVDLMCVHSLDDRFRLSAMLHFDIRKSFATGQPRLDCVKSSEGRKKLGKLFGERLENFQRLLFFAPSFRANMSTHSGAFCTDNIFRLKDYQDCLLKDFLERNNAALIYKLHPVEQTAFSGREFTMNPRCLELTDEMLFEADIRYDEILNAFDIMISDYSSIAFDFLLLDRPIVYLIPDYEEYRQARGFVFHNVDYYMPGPKVYCFGEMLNALEEAFDRPDAWAGERRNVRLQRFDFQDDGASGRCLETILGYSPVKTEYEPYVSPVRLKMPSSAELLRPYIKDPEILLIDSTRETLDRKALLESCGRAKKVYYITGEIPNQYRRLSSRNSYRIADLELYYEVRKCPNAEIVFIGGGVDCRLFSMSGKNGGCRKTRIGFAGTIDNRIYFAMAQYLCEAFPEFDIVFAGDIVGDFPAWLGGYENLHYVEASYEELPEMIRSFDVALLPFFGSHRKTVPTEFFQYLACGRQVVASDMPNLPECRALYRSVSIADSVEQVRAALKKKGVEEIAREGRRLAEQYDWGVLAERFIK